MTKLTLLPGSTKNVGGNNKIKFSRLGLRHPRTVIWRAGEQLGEPCVYPLTILERVSIPWSREGKLKQSPMDATALRSWRCRETPVAKFQWLEGKNGESSKSELCRSVEEFL